MKRTAGSRKPRASRAAASSTIEMTVSHLAIDPHSEMPILILKDARGEESVPIWIGLACAEAIAAELEKIALDRPMTHDLMATLLGACGARLERVEVTSVRDQIYYAALHLKLGARRPIRLDARPSDAIALALRMGAPIFVAREVIERSRAIDLERVAAPADRRCLRAARSEARPVIDPSPAQLREILESLSDEEFGKWKM